MIKCAIAVSGENEEGEKEIVYLGAGAGDTMAAAVKDAIDATIEGAITEKSKA